MADNKMNNIKFKSPVEIPDLVVAHDLVVKGTTTTEHSTDKIIEGAITVINGGGDYVITTLMGQVILTGVEYMNSTYLTFKDTIVGDIWNYMSDEVVLDNIEMYDQAGDLPILNKLRIVDEEQWRTDHATHMYGTVAHTGEELLIWSNQDGWIQLPAYEEYYRSYQQASISATPLTPKFKMWLNVNVEGNFENQLDVNEEAYGVLYDPVQQSVRLGRGYYYADGGFEFFSGEGEPIAVRDLKTGDDGSLVMWDADRYCLVKSPIKYVSNEESDHIEIERAIHVGEGRSTLGGGTIELAGDIADGARIKIYDENLNKHTSLNYSAIETGYGFFDKSITAHGHEDDEDGDVVHPAINAQGDIVATGKITSHDAQVDNTMVIGEGVAEGISSIATGVGSRALGKASVAMGNQVKAESDYSHAEGDGSTAGGVASHAEGYS